MAKNKKQEWRRYNRLPDELKARFRGTERELVEMFVAALTVYGEARGEGTEGMAGVAWVIRNRKEDRRWPPNYLDVCLQPWQFSCWNDDDPNREKLAKVNFRDRHFKEAFSIAVITLLSNCTADITSGANHYLHWKLAQSNPPSWYKEDKITEKIRNHVFLKL